MIDLGKSSDDVSFCFSFYVKFSSEEIMLGGEARMNFRRDFYLPRYLTKIISCVQAAFWKIDMKAELKTLKA